MTAKQVVQNEELGYFEGNFGQTLGRDPFYTCSRSIEWIKLLYACQQDNNAFYPQEHQSVTSTLIPEKNGIKEAKNSVKRIGDFAKGKSNAVGVMQSLKTPDVKANSGTEKYLPGWPLFSAPKISLQKCKRCSREFCSTINYRRHIRIHRRSLNVDKLSPKTRELLCAFWDELSLDKKKEILSFKDVSLEEVAGTSILNVLMSLNLRSGFSSLPQAYARASASLVDVIQAGPSKCPLSAQELFSVLDDASEKTFLCGGSAVSLQKFVFDGEVGKVALDVKNVTACASYLLEQKLVKAWLAHKDAESLRCQELLMEEEEAAKNRKAEILEKKRLKKTRLREQRGKGHGDGIKADVNGNSSDVVDSISCTELPNSGPSSGHERVASFISSAESLASIESSGSHDEVASPDVELDGGDLVTDCCSHPESDQKRTVASRYLASRATKGLGGYVSSSKSMVVKKTFTGSKNTPGNRQMIWTRKTKDERYPIPSSNGKIEEARERGHRTDSSALLIGSITVPLGNGKAESVSSHNNLSERSVGFDPFLNGGYQSSMKQWRPVSRQGTVESSTLTSCKKQIEPDSSSNDSPGQGSFDDNGTELDHVPRLLSIDEAVAFLAKRWEDALASDHVKFVSSQTSNADDCIDDTDPLEQSPLYSGRSILGNAENRMAVAGGFVLTDNGFSNKYKFRGKLDKNQKVKYIPKQKD